MSSRVKYYSCQYSTIFEHFYNDKFKKQPNIHTI